MGYIAYLVETAWITIPILVLGIILVKYVGDSLKDDD